MPNVHWNASGDKAVVQGIKGITAAERERIETMKLSGAEARRLDRVATQTLRNQQTESGKLLRYQEDLNKAYATGKLTQEQYTRAFQESRTKMRDLAGQATEATRRHTEVQRTAAEVLRRQETGQDRYNRELLKTGAAYRAGLITQKQFLTDAKRLRFEHLGGAEAARRAAGAERERAAALAAAALQEKRILSLRENARQRMIDQGGSRFNREQAERLRIQQEGAHVLRQLESAQDRYNSRLRETQRLRRSGAINDAQAVQLVKKYKQELREARVQSKETFGPSALSQIRSYALGIGGVSLAFSAVRYELTELDRIAEDKAQAQLTTSQAERQLLLNVGTASDSDAALVKSSIPKLVDKTGVSRRTVIDTTREVVSALPDVPTALRFADVGLQFTKDTLGGSAFAASLGRLGGALKTRDPFVAAGFQSEVLLRSGITENEKLGRELPRVVQAGTEIGGASPAFSASLFNALTIGGTDKDGEVSRTAFINLTDRAKKFFGDADRLKRLGANPEDLDQLNEQFARFRQDPTLVDEFFSEYNFKAAGKVGVLSVLKGSNPEANAAFELTRQGLEGVDLAKSGRSALARVNDSPLQITADLNRAVNTTREEFLLDQYGNLSNEAERKLVDAAFQARREAGDLTPRAFPALGLFLGAGTEVTANEALEFGQLQRGAAARFGGDLDGPAVASLDRMIEKLEVIAAATNRTAAAAEGGGDIQNPRQE